MKSSFLSVIILAALMVSSVWAQTAQSRKKTMSGDKKAQAAPPVKIQAGPASAKEIAEQSEEGSFDKFYERLRIGYFGAYSGSSLGQWDYRAMDEGGTRSKAYVQNIWNQLSFNYNFGARMSFVVNPRWMSWLGPTSNQATETNSLFSLDDALVGFQGVAFSSEDKKFNFWTRPGFRLPTSRSSRKSNITNQFEVLSAYTYDFNKTWQLGMFQLLRHWAYEQKYTAFRYRILHAPYIQYALNDTTRLQLYYEQYFENRLRLPSQNDQEVNVKDYWQNVMFAVNHHVTKKFNIMPFIGYIVDAKNISEKPLDAAWLGAWISYQIK